MHVLIAIVVRLTCPGEHTTIMSQLAVDNILIENPDLLEVAAEDSPLVRDVIAVLSTFGAPGPRLVSTWTVTLEGVYAIVHYSIDARGGDWMVGFDDQAGGHVQCAGIHQRGHCRRTSSDHGQGHNTRSPCVTHSSYMTSVEKHKRWLDWK